MESNKSKLKSINKIKSEITTKNDLNSNSNSSNYISRPGVSISEL